MPIPIQIQNKYNVSEEVFEDGLSAFNYVYSQYTWHWVIGGMQRGNAKESVQNNRYEDFFLLIRNAQTYFF